MTTAGGRYGPKSDRKPCIQVEKQLTIQVKDFQPQDRWAKGFGECPDHAA